MVQVEPLDDNIRCSSVAFLNGLSTSFTCAIEPVGHTGLCLHQCRASSITLSLNARAARTRIAFSRAQQVGDVLVYYNTPSELLRIDQVHSGLKAGPLCRFMNARHVSMTVRARRLS